MLNVSCTSAPPGHQHCLHSPPWEPLMVTCRKMNEDVCPRDCYSLPVCFYSSGFKESISLNSVWPLCPLWLALAQWILFQVKALVMGPKQKHCVLEMMQDISWPVYLIQAQNGHGPHTVEKLSSRCPSSWKDSLSQEWLLPFLLTHPLPGDLISPAPDSQSYLELWLSKSPRVKAQTQDCHPVLDSL